MALPPPTQPPPVTGGGDDNSSALPPPTQPPPVTGGGDDNSSALPPPTQPTPIGVDSHLERQRAGVNLSNFVLWIIAGAIAALLMFAAIAEGLRILDNSAQAELTQLLQTDNMAYQARSEAISSALRLGSEPAAWYAAASNEQARTAVDSRIKKLETWLMSVEDPAARSLQASLGVLRAAAARPEPERAGAIINAASQVDRMDLERLITDAKATPVLSPDRVAQLAALREVRTDIQTERREARAFLIEIFQLILINLLLPIITGLLGYVFGTQQTERKEN